GRRGSLFFFFSSRRRHTRFSRDWSSDVCSSDLASRWNGAALALTHLWTLGILGSAMLGARLQILAVACNVRVGAIRTVAGLSHVLLPAGTLLLAAGLLGWWPVAWVGAAALLGPAFALYLAAVAWALWQHRRQLYKGAREILVPVRGALAALACTVLIGL